jgi:hypothetical protein
MDKTLSFQEVNKEHKDQDDTMSCNDEDNPDLAFVHKSGHRNEGLKEGQTQDA